MEEGGNVGEPSYRLLSEGRYSVLHSNRRHFAGSQEGLHFCIC